MTKKKWDSFSDKKKKRITLQIYPPSLLYQEEEKAEMDEDSSKLLFEAEAETLKFYKDLVSHPQEKKPEMVAAIAELYEVLFK